jgi:cytochrome P450/NADPH-cytochrome P450 reductase
MIGAGTGSAPFRGFLQERAALRGQGVSLERSLKFCGCRNRDSDLLYADELRRPGPRRARILPDLGSGPRYVQDAMLAHAEQVWVLLQREASVFVCGNAATMAPGVRATLVQIFRDRTGTSEADGQAWLAGLHSADRFVEDIWGG